MRLTINNLLKDEIRPRSTFRILRVTNQQINHSPNQQQNPQQPLESQQQTKESNETSTPVLQRTSEYRENAMHIQMLSKSLFAQIFKEPQKTFNAKLIEK